MKKFSLLLLLFASIICYSQEKNEKEERISASEFPLIARTYFNTISQDVNYLKFYRETDGDKKSFEVKFKYKKEHYSVEFDTLGKLEDIEVVIKKRHVPKVPKAAIWKYFENNFRKTTIVKVQKQYVNTTNASDNNFIQRILEKPYNKHTHFEIIAEIKTKETHELREFTFDRHGKFEKSRKVTTSSYEHALY